MVALRKDVKLGLTLGGIVLSVVGVYVGLTALAGEKASGSGPGVNLAVSDPNGAPAKSGGSKEKHNAGGGSNSLSVTPPSTPIDTGNRADATHTTPPAGPGSVTPVSPVATPTASRQPGAAVDPWDDAFANGAIGGTGAPGASTAPRVTTTPDPRTANRGSAAQPSDIINALNSPAAGNAPQSTTSTPTATPPRGSGTALASGVEANGSLGQAATSSQLTQMTTHTVANGDTLYGIAAQYYGSSKYTQLIADANPGMNPNRLKVGETIKIPAQPAGSATPNSSSTTRPSSGSASAKSNAPIDPTKQYVVKSNDSLHKIADALYGDSSKWQAIYDLNKVQIGADPAKLKLGMVLALPSPPTKH